MFKEFNGIIFNRSVVQEYSKLSIEIHYSPHFHFRVI